MPGLMQGFPLTVSRLLTHAETSSANTDTVYRPPEGDIHPYNFADLARCRRQPGELLASAHAVDREFRVPKALEHTDVPVANPLLLCEDHSVTGSMCYLMSFEQGEIFRNPALPELPGERR